MGYTVATPIRDEESKAKMLAFLEINFRNWNEICPNKKHPLYYRGPRSNDEGLDYDHGPCRIGFDLHANAFDREYLFAICRWMALRVGRVDSFPTKIRPDLHGSFPVIVYDGDEATEVDEGDGPWPVIRAKAGDLPPDQQWCAVDSFGCRDPQYKHMHQLKEDYGYDGAEIIRSELKRLSELWLAFTG